MVALPAKHAPLLHGCRLFFTSILPEEYQKSLLPFFPIKPPFHPHSWEPAGMSAHFSRRCHLSIRGTVLSFWNRNLGLDSIKPRCCSQQIWFAGSSAFQISCDTQRGRQVEPGLLKRKVKMEVDISQKLAGENIVFGIMSNCCRLLSFHEYCISVTFAVATVVSGWRKVILEEVAFFFRVCVDSTRFLSAHTYKSELFNSVVSF